MAQSFPFTSLATLLAAAVYFALTVIVGRARLRYKVAAPAVAGPPDFERRLRVQMNTVEQIVVFLPVLWLCAVWVGDIPAAAGGLVWSVGRVLYAKGYYAAPEKRTIGFALTVLPLLVMFFATLAAVARWSLGS